MERNPGIILQASNVSKAFTLICLMVGELIYTEGVMDSPVPVLKTVHVDQEIFGEIRKKTIIIMEDKDVTLNYEECLQFYLIIDIVSRCFVTERNMKLEAMAQKNLDMSQTEFGEARRSFLFFAQNIITKFNERFEEFDSFKDFKEELHNS